MNLLDAVIGGRYVQWEVQSFFLKSRPIAHMAKKAAFRFMRVNSLLTVPRY